MSLYQMDNNTKKLTLVQPERFAAQGILERRDLQPFLRDHPQYIDLDLMTLTEEFGDLDGSQRRVDLLGLDTDGNLVVIELKIVDDGSHMELQAIRYAAMVSALDFEAVVAIHEAFLKKQGRDETAARQTILDFLKPNTPISNKPRIVLIAPSFSREITTAVLWLNGIGLDIRCIEVKLYNLQSELYLDMEQVIPLPSAADYQFRMREKSDTIQRSVAQRRNENSIGTLVNAGILQTGSRIRMIRPPRPSLTLGDTNVFRAKYVSDNRFEWDYDGATYAISTLTREVCQHLGGSVGAGAFAGPEYWALEGENVSLSDMADRFRTQAIGNVTLSPHPSPAAPQGQTIVGSGGETAS